MGLDIYYKQKGKKLESVTGFAYSAYMDRRDKICQELGLGRLEGEYRGFGGQKKLPSTIKEPLMAFVNHSDCSGQIAVKSETRVRIKERMERLIKRREDRLKHNYDDRMSSYVARTKKLAEACNICAKEGCKIIFG